MLNNYKLEKQLYAPVIKADVSRYDDVGALI